MTRGPTTAHAAKKAIVALLKAQPELADVQVEYGNPVGSVEKNAIFTTNVVWIDEQWSNAQRTGRTEKYEITLFITANTSGGKQEEVSERAYDMLKIVEAVVEGPLPPTPLTDLGIYQAELRMRSEHEGTWNNTGRFSALQCVVAVTARK